MILDDLALPGGPVDDALLGPLLLSQGMGGAQEIVRVHRPEPTAAFSRRDSRRPGFDRAADSCSAAGFVPIIRPQGGKLAAYHRGSVVIDHVVRVADPTSGLKVRFERFARLHADVLTGFGLDARIGELPGEYCPGEFSINVAGTTKIVGSAQRITRDGWLFSTIIQVSDSVSIRDVLTAAYADIGYDLDPATIGSMEDQCPGVTAQQVQAALIEAYSADVGAGRGPLSVQILDELASLRSAGR
ncbi:lipoyl protein ligase domain-containing protein [Aeromicrobium sp.]|uniref:lipoyl protein ligase domain-containing protein n=1 Tax=Aeromicrobium sp. TaxID=1871063 RepID=UPI003C4B347D